MITGVGFAKGWMGTEKDPGPVNVPDVAIALEANGIIAKRPGGTSVYPSAVFCKKGSESTKDGMVVKAALIEGCNIYVAGRGDIPDAMKAGVAMSEASQRWVELSTAQVTQLKADPYNFIYAALTARTLIR
jgi:hypothetical protein